jgi:hypothetical protein
MATRADALDALVKAVKSVPVAVVPEMLSHGACARCVGRFLGVRLHEYYT